MTKQKMAKAKNFKVLWSLLMLLLLVVLFIKRSNLFPQKPAVVQTGQAGRDDNMALGNPTNAGTADKNNYLLQKQQYALSYNNSKGIANWVSWHLSTAWQGNAGRCNCFRADDALPAGFFKVNGSDYVRSGFDRGHMCPSDDRSAGNEDNAVTFLMTNMAPQAPWLNEKTWERLEAYCRKLTTEGNELYIIAGSYGTGGEGRNGVANTIANGRIQVPAHFWKVILVLPVGDSDLERISSTTRVIAVDMPNRQDVDTYDWWHYRCTVDDIEAATGCDLLSALPQDIQQQLERIKDDGPVK